MTVMKFPIVDDVVWNGVFDTRTTRSEMGSVDGRVMAVDKCVCQCTDLVPFGCR